MGKILPILLAIIGLGGGVGAGLALRPAPEPVAMESPCGEPAATTDSHEAPANDHSEQPAEDATLDYVKLNNQFVVPVVDEGRVQSLVVLSLSLEIQQGQSEAVYKMEPKLRDSFLQVLFDHANAGGFSGAFTRSERMTVLRTALHEAARKLLGNMVSDVLIVDVVRQDV